MAMWMSRLSVCGLIIVSLGAGGFAAAETRRGQYSYGAERSCASAGKLSAEYCANAAANAQAEFEEKAPRFPTRAACESAFASTGCSVGFKGSDGWEGKKAGVYFTPRMSGFQVTVSSEREITVTPYLNGAAIGFSRRSALHKDTRIDPHVAAQARDNWRARAAAGGAIYGVGAPPPGLGRGTLPPPPPVDPNFDCKSVLEPSAAGSADTGCYLAPARRP